MLGADEISHDRGSNRASVWDGQSRESADRVEFRGELSNDRRIPGVIARDVTHELGGDRRCRRPGGFACACVGLLDWCPLTPPPSKIAMMCDVVTVCYL